MPNPAMAQEDSVSAKDNVPAIVPSPTPDRKGLPQNAQSSELRSKQSSPANPAASEIVAAGTEVAKTIPEEEASKAEEILTDGSNSDISASEEIVNSDRDNPIDSTASNRVETADITKPSILLNANENSPSQAPGVPIAGTWLPLNTDPAKVVVLAWETPAEGLAPNVQRLTPGVGLKLRTHIFVPAIHRTHFSLVPGGRLEAVGPSEWEFLQALPTYSMRLYRGRFVLSAHSTGRSFDVHIADRVVHLEWGDSLGNCVVQVEPMIDPEAIERPRANVYIQPIDVPLKWAILSSANHPEEVTQQGQELSPGSYLAVTPWQSPTTVPVDNLPSWVADAEDRPIDIAGASELAQTLQVDAAGPCTAKLRGMLGNRRSELAALALRGLISLGEFDSIFGESGLLTKDSMRAHWDNIVADIKATLAAHPEYWPRLREATEAAYGEKASLIESLIIGPTQQQLQEGADRQLVDLLKVDQPLEIRMLAFHWLKSQTGQDLGYLPERPTPLTVEAWQQRVNQAGWNPK